jgi:hypothetical protein
MVVFVCAIVQKAYHPALSRVNASPMSARLARLLGPSNADLRGPGQLLDRCPFAGFGYDQEQTWAKQPAFG